MGGRRSKQGREAMGSWVAAAIGGGGGAGCHSGPSRQSGASEVFVESSQTLAPNHRLSAGPQQRPAPGSAPPSLTDG